MLDLDEVPSPLVRRILEQDAADDDALLEAAVSGSETQGDALVPEMRACLELAHELPPEDAEKLRAGVAAVASVARVDDLLDLVLRDQVRRPHDERLHDALWEFDAAPEAWIDAALRVYDASEDDEDELHGVCAILLATAEPGTEGVLDVLLSGLEVDPVGAMEQLAAHGDPAAGPHVLGWQREQGDPESFDEELALAVYRAVRAAQDWGARVDDDDIGRANLCAEMVRADLETELRDLEDAHAEVAATLRDLRDLWSEKAGGSGFGHTTTGSASRNAPCRCGSGRKTKKCCG